MHSNEAFYSGSNPKQKPITTDRDMIDSQPKFLRDVDSDDKADPAVQDYYESLIKDCVLVDLGLYKEKQVVFTKM